MTTATMTAGKISRQVWWKTERARWAGMATAGLAVVGLAIWWFALRPFVTTDDARVAMTLVRVAPEGVSGRVEKVDVDEGTRVKPGMVLVELDHRVAQAQFEKAQARDKLAQHELARMQQLARQHGAPARDLDRTVSEAQAAAADLTLAQVNLENTYLKSPTGGVVVKKATDVGNILEPGQVAVVVADDENAWVSANVEETSAGLLKPGQHVSIDVDEGGSLTGEVENVNSAAASQFSLIPAENASGNYTKVVQRIPVKIKLDPHPDVPLRAGASVEIKVRVR